MSAIVNCPACGQANHVPDLAGGKTAVCGKCKEPLPAAASVAHPVTATDATFRNLVSGSKPVVVDFWAAWCGPCRIIAPVIEQLAQSRSDVVFAKLNVDENPQTASSFRVNSIPTLIFFADGEEKGRVVGAAGRAQIERAITQHLNR